MSEMVKEWSIQMLDNELKEIEGCISNVELWIAGSKFEEDIAAHKQTLENMLEYKALLQNLRKKAEEGTLDA